MQYLMQINHMLLVYFVGGLAALLVLLIVVFWKLRSQMRETKALSIKLDRMIDEVLYVGKLSDHPRHRNKL